MRYGPIHNLCDQIVYTGPSGKASACIHFFLITFLVLGVILIRHLFPQDKFLPAHVLIVYFGFLFYVFIQ
jgi:hypothetical protein